MKRLFLTLAVAASLFGFGAVAQANTFAVGDVFAAVNNGNVQHYNSAGVLLETLNTGLGGFTTGMAQDATGNLYVTNFSAGSVTKFTGPLDPHTASLFLSQGGSPESIALDLSGNFYVSSAGTGFIGKYDSAGNFLSSLSTGGRADWIDLNAANTKIFFTEDISKGVKVLDIATNTLDPDFNSSVGNFALRIRPNGEVLVANSTDIRRLDSTGTDIQTYDVAGVDGFFALNLDPDGTSFWTGSFANDTLYKFDIATGALLLTVPTGTSGNNLFGVSVFGQITVGGPPPPPSGVPEPTSLALLGVGLVGMAGYRWRRRKQ